MPKQKTNKSAVKRFKRTATGKILYRKAGSGHLLTAKSTKRKRNLRKAGVLSDSERKRVSALM